jgi:hypothetical protein
LPFSFGTFFLAFSIAWVGLLSTSPVSAEQSTALLARQIREKLELIQAVRTERLDLDAQIRQEKQRLEDQIEKLKKDKNQLQADLNRIQDDNHNLQNQLTGVNRDNRLLEDQLQASCSKLDPFVKRIRSRVAGGIAWKYQQRLEKLDGITQGLNEEELSAKVMAMQGYFSFVSEEFRFSNTIELYNAFLPIGENQHKHAYVIRMGLVGQSAISENNQHGAVDIKSVGDAWQNSLDTATQNQMRHALGILQRKRQPELRPVPVWVAPTRLSTDGSP